jgi:predicted CopG family antitoxin
MLHELTIQVDDTVYKTLKPMIEQKTIGAFLHDLIQIHNKNRQAPAITALRRTLHQIDTSDLREEEDRSL